MQTGRLPKLVLELRLKPRSPASTSCGLHYSLACWGSSPSDPVGPPSLELGTLPAAPGCPWGREIPAGRGHCLQWAFLPPPEVGGSCGNRGRKRGVGGLSGPEWGSRRKAELMPWLMWPAVNRWATGCV